MATNGGLDRDALGKAQSAGVPGGGDTVRTGQAGEIAVRAVGGIGERLVRASFRTGLRKQVEGEITATEKVQNAMSALRAGETVDTEAMFADTDEPTANALRGMLADLDRTVGGLGAAVEQGLIPQQLALSRLDTVVREAANRFPGFGEDITQVINNSRLGGFDPRGTVARSILGIPDKTKKERTDIEKQKQERLDELYKNVGNTYGDAVSLPVLNAVESGAMSMDEGILALSDLDNVRQAAERAKIESDRLTEQGQVLSFAVRPFMPLAFQHQTSQANLVMNTLKRAAQDRIRWAKEGPALLMDLKRNLEGKAANASNELRASLQALKFEGAMELSEADIATEVSALRNFYSSMAQAADEFTKNPERFLEFSQLMSNVDDMERVPALYDMARFLNIDGLAPLITMGTDFANWRMFASKIIVPATFPGQTSNQAIDAHKQEGVKVVSNFFSLLQHKGVGDARAYLADIPSGQAESTRNAIDIELSSQVALARAGKATLTPEWYRGAFEMMRQTNDWKGTKRSDTQWTTVVENMLAPDVLGKMPKDQQDMVIDMVRPDVEDRTVQKLNKLSVYNANMEELVGRPIFSQPDGGAPVFDSELFNVDASGKAVVRRELMLLPSSQEDIQRYKERQKARGRIVSDLNAVTEMRKINGNWEAAAKVYNDEVLPLMRLNQRVYGWE